MLVGRLVGQLPFRLFLFLFLLFAAPAHQHATRAAVYTALFTGLVYIWGTQQQPTTIQNFTGLILRPHMGWYSSESNLQSDFDIFWINAKKGLFFSE